MTSKAEREGDLADAREMLEAWCPRGSTVYSVLRHVSRSGMMRHIDLYAIVDGRPQYISGYAALVMGWTRSNEGALKIGGAGMDMGFHAVHSLSTALYGWVDGKYSHEGAYALKHEWI